MIAITVVVLVVMVIAKKGDDDRSGTNYDSDDVGEEK